MDQREWWLRNEERETWERDLHELRARVRYLLETSRDFRVYVRAELAALAASASA